MSSSSSSISSSPPVNLICSVCGEKSSLRCSKCLGALYCSIPCQKKDWKVHKVICKKAEKVKKSFEEAGCHTVEEIDAKLEEDRMLAELGIASAQYNLGLSYSNGLGVSVDKVEALKWYRLAAEQGISQAQNNLGHAYFNGVGVSVDKVEGLKWFRLAANQGDADAQLNLGSLYFNGDGVSVDKVESVKWYRLAAEQGHEKAQFNLGNAYTQGNGVSVDKVESIKWYRLAAEQGMQMLSTILVLHILQVMVSLLITLKQSNGTD